MWHCSLPKLARERQLIQSVAFVCIRSAGVQPSEKLHSLRVENYAWAENTVLEDYKICSHSFTPPVHQNKMVPMRQIEQWQCILIPKFVSLLFVFFHANDRSAYTTPVINVQSLPSPAVEQMVMLFAVCCRKTILFRNKCNKHKCRTCTHWS